jgi:hypothetical protein
MNSMIPVPNSLTRPILCLLVMMFCAACESQAGKEAAPPAAGATPPEFQPGEAKFTAHCAACHGARAVGTAQGPPLIHKIYEPNHHADIAFQRAALNGVRAITGISEICRKSTGSLQTTSIRSSSTSDGCRDKQASFSFSPAARRYASGLAHCLTFFESRS